MTDRTQTATPNADATATTDGDGVIIRAPRIADGAGIWELVKGTGVLDVNSSYQYLLFCREFADSSVVAEHDNKIVGFVTGFHPPRRPDVIFVWQVGVDASMRGRKVGRRLLDGLVRHGTATTSTHMETTISPSNKASQALFHSFAKAHDASVTEQPCFAEADFPQGHNHEAEVLYRIGPLTRS